MIQFSPKQVVIKFGDVEIKGYASGEFVQVDEIAEPVPRIRRTGSITVKLLRHPLQLRREDIKRL